MTLGKKLSNYRKLSGFTQQQLGEKLNLSPQAISKWENDLAEPDISTLRALSELYNISIDELLSDEPAFQGFDRSADREIPHNNNEETALGICKNCGITVTEENLGRTEPYVICKKCLEEQEAEQEAEQKQTKEKAEKTEAERKQDFDRRVKRSWITAGIVGAAVLALVIFVLTREINTNLIIGSVFLVISSFTLAFSLFYDTFVIDAVAWMLTRSIRWPGLIFSFDIDGFIWAICMKILFAVLGFAFGILTFVLGIAVGLVCSIFVFPYLLVRIHNDRKNGTVGDYADGPF